MTRKKFLHGIVAMFLLGLAGSLHPATVQAESAASASPGLAAMQKAASNGKYVFIYFWKQNDRQTQEMFGVFQRGTAKLAESADAVSVNITDPKEQTLVDQFGVSRAPMPLLLVVAPNGAVTQGTPGSFTEEQLREAFVSRATAASLKALQERKLVLVCVQNPTAPIAFSGVNQFTADLKFANSTAVVTVNASDQAEAKFFQSLQLDPTQATGTVVLLAPPGRAVAKFASTATKEQIVAQVTAATSSCCSGGSCGPGGCGQ